MKNKFENTIKKVSQGYPEQVPEDSWETIQFNLKLKPENKKTSSQINYWKVASLAFFICSIVLLYRLLYMPTAVESNGLSSISDYYKKIEKKYQADILKVSEEIELNEVDREKFESIFMELQTLDSLNNSYKNDLNTMAKKEKLVPILIDYYEKKLRLLRKLELEINRKKNEKNKQITI